MSVCGRKLVNCGSFCFCLRYLDIGYYVYGFLLCNYQFVADLIFKTFPLECFKKLVLVGVEGYFLLLFSMSIAINYFLIFFLDVGFIVFWSMGFIIN